MGYWKVVGFVLLVLAGALITALLYMQSRCPAQGIAFTAARAQLARLKNRETPPQQTEFDDRVTLTAMLEPGDDTQRWSESRGAAVEGYVVDVYMAGIEAANCFSAGLRDTHIELALRADAPPRERLVVEVTPRLEAWARARGLDWSEAALRRDLKGRFCRFEGWLFFDREHGDESENTSPGLPGNWRRTAWEIHPVTAIKVLR